MDSVCFEQERLHLLLRVFSLFWRTINQKGSPSFHLNDLRYFLFQIAELNIRHEQEKAQTLRAHQIERDSSLKEHEQEKVSRVLAE